MPVVFPDKKGRSKFFHSLSGQGNSMPVGGGPNGLHSIARVSQTVEPLSGVNPFCGNFANLRTDPIS